MEPLVFACLQAGVVLDPAAGIREVGDGLHDSENAQSVECDGFEEGLVENSYSTRVMTKMPVLVSDPAMLECGFALTTA